MRHSMRNILKNTIWHMYITSAPPTIQRVANRSELGHAILQYVYSFLTAPSIEYNSSPF